jgi:hypothetical protein
MVARDNFQTNVGSHQQVACCLCIDHHHLGVDLSMAEQQKRSSYQQISSHGHFLFSFMFFFKTTAATA